MDGCDIEIISQLSRTSRYQVSKIINSESIELEITKSLLNLLYNIVHIGSVPVSPTQKAYFDKHSQLVFDLLKKSKSLKWKKAQLENNVSLVINIAASCPTVAGL